MRVRRFHTAAHVFVSDTSHHDTHFVRETMQQVWMWLVLTYSGLERQITSVHVRLDGTSQHFKSEPTLSSLVEFRQRFGLERVRWDFGRRIMATLNGSWDGVASCVKRQLKHYLLGDESRVIRSSQDVSKLLNTIFNDPQRPSTQRTAINQFHIQYLPEQLVERSCLPFNSSPIKPPNDHMRRNKMFSFDTVGETLRWRVLNCWCSLRIAGGCCQNIWDEQSIAPKARKKTEINSYYP